MNIFIRVRTDKQIENVAKLANIIWKEYFTTMIEKEIVDYMLKKIQSKKAISNQIRDGYQYYLIKPSKYFIGYFAIIHKIEINEIILSKLYILNSERGKGLGNAAMKFIDNIAHQKNCKKISLTVFNKNIKAIKTYEKNGFKKTGSLFRDIGNNIILHDLSMEKVLIK